MKESPVTQQKLFLFQQQSSESQTEGRKMPPIFLLATHKCYSGGPHMHAHDTHQLVASVSATTTTVMTLDYT
jgi:hypothetical protein